MSLTKCPISGPSMHAHYYNVAESVAENFRRMQASNRLDDVIEDAAKAGVEKALRHYAPERVTDALIVTCSKNSILNALRKKGNSATTPYDTEILHNMDLTPSDADVLATDELVDLARQRERLLDLLSGPLLTGTQKRVIKLMMSSEDYNQRQIADILGVQQPAVSKAYQKAIQRLRAAVRPPLAA